MSLSREKQYRAVVSDRQRSSSRQTHVEKITDRAPAAVVLKRDTTTVLFVTGFHDSAMSLTHMQNLLFGR
jgi:hypothetical protein